MILDKIGFENWMRLKQLSERTIKEYLYYLDKLALMSELNQEVVNEFLLKYNQQIARAFVKNYQTFVWESKAITIHPMEDVNRIRDISIPKITGRKKRRVPSTVTKLEVFAIENVMTSERNKLMLLITFYAGLRISGLLSLRPYDFQWKKWMLDKTKPCELKVIEKGDRERVVFIPPEVAERLINWIRNIGSKQEPNPEKPMFKVKKDRWEKLVKRDSGRVLRMSITPHSLRHGCATYLLENGWNIKEVQEYLGHASIATTEVYLHINKDVLKEKFMQSNSQE